MLALLHSTIAFLPLKMIVKFAVVVDGCDARARPSIPDVWSHVIHDGRVHFGSIEAGAADCRIDMRVAFWATEVADLR